MYAIRSYYGEEIDQKQLVERLVRGGYEAASLVQNVGEFCIRGGIVDIFAPGHEWPVRLDFFGDTVESLRTFDPRITSYNVCYTKLLRGTLLSSSYTLSRLRSYAATKQHR